jgi:hypothetical protein
VRHGSWGSRRGTKRRQAVFKSFAAVATFCNDIVLPHLELMLEPLHRSEMKAKNEVEAPALMLKKRPTEDTISEEAQLAKDLMHVMGGALRLTGYVLGKLCCGQNKGLRQTARK